MSDITALSAIRIDASTGRPMLTNSPAVPDGPPDLRPIDRPRRTNATTGMPIVPMNPSGSRTKILISSQVSFKRPRIGVLIL